VLLLIVPVTTLMQRGLDETTATRVLRQASTNLFQMTRDAPRVLFLSAFLPDHGRLLVDLVLFTLVMVPVERWIGTYRFVAPDSQSTIAMKRVACLSVGRGACSWAEAPSSST